MKAVVLAAGHGKRMMPFTSHRPKSMLPVAGKPVLQRGLEYMRDMLGIDEVIIITGHLRYAIHDYFKGGEKLGMKLKYVVQHAEQTKGLAAALGLVEGMISEDFVVYLGDNLFSADLSKVLDCHMKNGNAATLHVEEHDDPSRFGVVVTNGAGRISELVEKPKNPPSNTVITGFYVLSPVVFDVISGLKPSARGEYELTDALQKLVDKGFTVEAVKMDGWRHDIGLPYDLLRVNQTYLDAFGSSIEGTLHNTEVIDPVYVAPGTVIRDSEIGPYAMIEGKVVIEDAAIKNSVVLEGTQIKNSRVHSSVIGSKCKINGARGYKFLIGDMSEVNFHTES